MALWKYATAALIWSCALGTGFGQVKSAPGANIPSASASAAVELQRGESALSGSKSAQTPAPPPAWKSTPEGIALQEQNNVIRQYHSSLLDTVYWALGAVVTLAVLLVGAGWLINFKLYEADKQRIKEQLEGQIENVRLFVASQISEGKADVQRALDSALQAAADRTSNEQITLRSEFKNSTDKLETRLAELQKELGEAVNGFALFDRRIYDVQASVREVEEHAWELKGVHTNVLITAGQGLRAAVNAKNVGAAKNRLEKMRDTIKDHLLTRDKPVDKEVIDIARRALGGASELIPIETAEVLQLLDQVKST